MANFAIYINDDVLLQTLSANNPTEALEKYIEFTYGTVISNPDLYDGDIYLVVNMVTNDIFTFKHRMIKTRNWTVE